MKIKAFIILVGIIILALFGGWWILRSLKKEVNTSLEKKTSPLYFFNAIDFDDGDYVLILEVKDKGRFWIDDETLLKANRNELKISISPFNYLPGEGYRGYGALLFKDRQVIRSKHAGIFNTFEYGSLLENARPFDSIAVEERYYSTRENLEKLNLDSLNNNPTIYGLQIPEFDSVDYSHRLKVTFPSVAVPVHYKEDDPYHQPIVSNGFEKDEFGKKLYLQIKNDIRNLSLSKYRLLNQQNRDAWQSSHSGYLFLNNKKTGEEIRENNNPLWIDDFVLQNFEIEILCDKESLERFRNHDWGNYISPEMANHEELFQSVSKKYPHLKPASETTGIDGLQEKWKVEDALFVRKYEVRFIRKKE